MATVWSVFFFRLFSKSATFSVYSLCNSLKFLTLTHTHTHTHTHTKHDKFLCDQRLPFYFHFSNLIFPLIFFFILPVAVLDGIWVNSTYNASSLIAGSTYISTVGGFGSAGVEFVGHLRYFQGVSNLSVTVGTYGAA